MRFGEMPCKNCSRFFCICSYRLTRSICSELLPPFGDFGAGNGMKDAPFFQSFLANGKGVARHVLFGVFNSNAGFVGIIVAALFSVPYVPERCFLVSDPYHVWDLKNSICYVSCRRSWILSSWLCVSLSPIDLSTLSSMTHHIPWMLSIGQGTRTCHTDLYLIVCPLCCFQLLLPHVH